MQKLYLQRGLYAITDSTLLPPARFETAVAEALRGGARVVQYRDKSADAGQRRRQAGALRELCAACGVPLLINDDVELALAVGAHGVHLGRDDPALEQARARLGRHAIIGVSCYNDLRHALAAQAAGADYVAFGRFFSSHTKPGAVPADLDLLRRARPLLHLPIAVIGGITPANGGPLVAAGADLLAAVHGVFGGADGYAAARAYSALF